MKILIFALPRTGSKFVSQNVINYLGKPPHPIDMYNGIVKHKRLTVENGIIIPTDEPIDHTTEDFFRNRIDVVREAQGSLAVKIHQERLVKYPELLKETISVFDHIVIVERKDLFNQLLSQAISIRSNLYIPGQEMMVLKHKFRMNPISIDTAHWISLIEDYKKNNAIDFGVEFPRVYAEDLFNATSKEFCAALNLPPKEFAMNKNTVEFGSKEKFVTNYAELKEIFNTMLGVR